MEGPIRRGIGGRRATRRRSLCPQSLLPAGQAQTQAGGVRRGQRQSRASAAAPRPRARFGRLFASYVTNPEKGKGAEIFLPSIARLPDSYEKVQVILQALIELEPSQVVGLHQQALEIARRLNESLLEAYCLVGMAYREQDTEKAQAQWDQAQTLMAG